jgi:hypothetical protein
MPPAAIAIGMGVGGIVTSLYGAHKAAAASHEASQVQQDAATRAQALNERVYADQTQRLSPYVNAGTSSLAALQARYGQSDPAALAGRANAFVNSARYGMPPAQAGFPAPTGAPMQQPMQQPGGGGMPERGPELPPGGGNPMSLAAVQSGGGMVTVADDTGATRQVPRAQAQMYAQRGFKVMG